MNRAFCSVFRFVSDNISDHFCIVCTQTAFFIKKRKALGDSDDFSDNCSVVYTGSNNNNFNNDAKDRFTSSETTALPSPVKLKSWTSIKSTSPSVSRKFTYNRALVSGRTG